MKQQFFKRGGVRLSFLKSAKMMAATTLATLALQASAQNQMRTWTLPPNRVNFAPTPSSVALPLASAGQYRVANGAYDANGNLLFYVKDLNVYKADGTSMGTLTGYTYFNSGAMGCGGSPITANVQFKEIAIVPVPNSCSKYYVIWTGTSLCNSQTAYAHYATVDVAVNTVTNLPSTSNLGGAFSVSAAIAVSKVKADGFRKLYVQGGDKIVTFTIGATTITQVVTTTLANYSTSAVAPATSELELSPDGTQLAWGDYNNPVGYRIQGIPTTGILAATYDMNNNNNKFLITTSGWVSGTEFDASGNVYYNLNSYTINTHNGIWKLLSTSITPASFRLTGANTTASFNSSQLELGYDGKLYAINNSNQMVAVDLATSTPSVVNSGTSVQSNGTNTVATFSHYSLPDQIDGESYANFKGKADLIAPSIGFTSFGADRRTGTYGDYDGSNCDMVMQEYAVGVYDAYKLTIYASDANSTQGTQIYTSNLVNGTFPATELTSLANNYIRINKGYYLVKLEVSNGGCNAANTQTFLINVSQWFVYNSLGVKNTAVVTAANGNFKVFNCNAITLAPAKYKQTQYKLSLQSANSSGQIITGAPGTTLSLLPITFTTGLYPTTADLRTWPGTNNFIQNMINGYILATLELKDDCNQSITKTALIWVNSLGLGSADYMINYGNGTSIDPDLTTLAAPAQVGQLGLGVNANSSTGFIDAYTMKIEKMNQSNGTVIQTVCNNPAGTAVPNSNAANIPQIGLNSYTYSKCGQASAYFMQPANQNQVYKLSFTVSNVCGTSAAKVGYFLNSDPNARMGDAEEIANANVAETIASQGHAMYPNPSTGKAVLHYFLESESNVSLSIADVQGNKIATVLENAARSAGTYSQAIDLTNYPDGIYYYRLNTDKAVVGKIVKTSK